MNERIRDRCVLVTGGTGYVGSRLIERLRQLGPRDIRVLSRSSAGSRLPSDVRMVVGEITDRATLADALSGVEVVFHLAAMKDVRACEARPADAVRANIDATIALVAAAAQEPTLQHVVAVSTTSAVLARNVYGMTKALAERVTLSAQLENETSFTVVRLGNVWGAPGSVLERWLTSDGDGIVVTDPEMTRFAIAPSDAVALVLAAVDPRHRGAVLMEPMPAYRVGDLANAVARATRRVIRVIGARDGELAYERLYSAEEAPFARIVDGRIVIVRDRAGTPMTPLTSATARRLSAIELDALLAARLTERVTT